MKRVQLFEFHDLTWFPRLWRDILTDYLTYVSCQFGAFHPILIKLKVSIGKARSRRIIDLCSGASGPLIKLRRHIYDEDGSAMPVLLTDKFPNLTAFRKANAATRGALTFHAESVDAMDVPEDLVGFRTLFASFHHFKPAQAVRILQDAVDKQSGIGIFEWTERSFVWCFRAAVSPFLFWVHAPRALKPLHGWKFFWVYVVPVPVFAFAWDCLVSCLRTYTEAELLELTNSVCSEHYEWETGHVRSSWGGRITYLIGTPKVASAAGALVGVPPVP